MFRVFDVKLRWEHNFLKICRFLPENGDAVVLIEVFRVVLSSAVCLGILRGVIPGSVHKA